MAHIRQRILILLVIGLTLYFAGACEAGARNLSLRASTGVLPHRYSQQVAPTPYPTLSACFADPLCTNLLIVGHRGTIKFAPENTIVAFERAIECGVDVIELDVRNTADGHLVVIHDSTVDRTTDGHGQVNQMTLAEIKALNVRFYYPCISLQKIPTFKEALLFLKGRIPINVDVKTDLLEEIVREVEQLDMIDQAYMLTKGIEEGKRFLAANPNVKLQTRAKSAEEVYRYLEELHPMAVQVDLSFLIPEIVEAIHDAGAKVYSDTSGSFDNFGQIGYAVLQWHGVDVIETDRILAAVHYARKIRK